MLLVAISQVPKTYNTRTPMSLICTCVTGFFLFELNIRLPHLSETCDVWELRGTEESFLCHLIRCTNTTNHTSLIDNLQYISCNQFTTDLCNVAGRERGSESPEGLSNFPGVTRPNGKGAILMSFHPVSKVAPITSIDLPYVCFK